MEDVTQNNKLAEENAYADEYLFKYNFISLPWDDRTTSSKIGIIAMLLAILLAIVVCFVINFVVHYRGYDANKATVYDVKCPFVKMEDYLFVARIHSATTNELLCLGAVVSKTSVLASGVCVKSGSIRLRLGSQADPRCKKSFSVNMIEAVYHDGVISKHLVLLSTFENMADCANIIQIGNKLDLKSEANIFGRPMRHDKSLTRQPAKFADPGKPKTLKSVKNLNVKNMICVEGLSRCPVRAGDLLVQNNELYGLASTSAHYTDQSKIAFFADIKLVQKELLSLDSEIIVE